MKILWTAEEIAEVLNVSPDAIRHRAEEERWISIATPWRGGKVSRYMRGLLPENVRIKLVAAVVIEKMEKRVQREKAAS